jgi:hypothetical protein
MESYTHTPFALWLCERALTHSRPGGPPAPRRRARHARHTAPKIRTPSAPYLCESVPTFIPRFIPWPARSGDPTSPCRSTPATWGNVGNCGERRLFHPVSQPKNPARVSPHISPICGNFTRRGEIVGIADHLTGKQLRPLFAVRAKKSSDQGRTRVRAICVRQSDRELDRGGRRTILEFPPKCACSEHDSAQRTHPLNLYPS